MGVGVAAAAAVGRKEEDIKSRREGGTSSTAASRPEPAPGSRNSHHSRVFSSIQAQLGKDGAK